jgi:excisionase family DNA binding protein
MRYAKDIGWSDRGWRRIVRVREVATKLEVSSSLVYLLISEGRLRCTRHGLKRGTIRISEEQLAEYRERANGKPVREQLKHLKMS